MTFPASHEGGCLCKAVRFRVTGDPLHSVICHCHSCRRASGAPSVAWLTFDRGQVEFVAGEARSFPSSPGVVRRFCPNCGSQIAYETAASPACIDLTTATLDDPTAFPPAREVWVRDKLWWEAVNHALDHYPADLVKGGQDHGQ
jgi:hypothetical protein